MKKVCGSGEINPVSMRNYYNLMRNSFESAVRGEARNLKRSELDACYEWRIINILIKDTLELNSSFSYEEWDSFVHSCDKGRGLSSNNIKTVERSIGKLCSSIMAETDNLWRSDEERGRLKDAVVRLNKFLSVDMYLATPLRRNE